jgi:hypothetical protein
VISVTDGTGTRRVTSRRLATLILLLLDNEDRLPLDQWRVGELLLTWSGDEAKIAHCHRKDFQSRRSSGSAA